jgi:hypothetical protein
LGQAHLANGIPTPSPTVIHKLKKTCTDSIPLKRPQTIKKIINDNSCSSVNEPMNARSCILKVKNIGKTKNIYYFVGARQPIGLNTIANRYVILYLREMDRRCLWLTISTIKLLVLHCKLPCLLCGLLMLFCGLLVLFCGLLVLLCGLPVLFCGSLMLLCGLLVLFCELFKTT